MAPPSKILLKYRGINVLPIAENNRRFGQTQTRTWNHRRDDHIHQCFHPQTNGFSLYRFGPSSKQKVMVSMASSSKNSVVNASHQRLSQSCTQGKKYPSENTEQRLKPTRFNTFIYIFLIQLHSEKAIVFHQIPELLNFFQSNELHMFLLDKILIFCYFLHRRMYNFILLFIS